MEVTCEQKWCSGCTQTLPVEEFYRNAARKDGRQGQCKACQAARYKMQLAEQPEKVRARQRVSQTRHRRVRRHGITEQEFAEKLASQGGVCAGCRQVPERPVLDHDHSCCGPAKACVKCVRWVLCANCNMVLGYAKDNPETLRRMAELLEDRATLATMTKEMI